MPDEMMHEVGAFEPHDAKRILDAFETAGIPFEVEADYTDLTRPGRTVEMVLGMYPPGSKLVIFVPEPGLSRAQGIVAELFRA